MRSNQRGRNRWAWAALASVGASRQESSLSAFLSRVPRDPAGQSGPSKARDIAWPILSAAATISRSPTWAYLNVIRASL